MKNLITLLALAVFCLCITNSVQAQTLSLDNYFDQLKKSHPVFQKEKMTSQIETERREGLLGTQDWNVFSSTYVSQKNPALAFSGPERISSLNVSGGVSKLFWKTGGRFTASASTGAAFIKLPPGAVGFPDNFQQHEINVSYSQPLNRNKDGFLDQLEYNSKQYSIDFWETISKENLENFMEDAAMIYLNWVYISEQKEIVNERLNLSNEELDNVKKRKEAFLVDEIDVIRAQDAVRFWTQNLVLVEAMYKAMQAELAVLTQNDDLITAEPDFDLYSIQQLEPLEQDIAEVRSNSRLLEAVQHSMDNMEYSRDGYEELMKPDITFESRINLKRAEDKFAKSLMLNKPDVSIGLSYNFSKENTTAKSKVLQIDMEIEQLENESKSIFIKLSSKLTNLHIQIREMEKVLELNKEQIESAKNKTEKELELYNQGRGNLTFVLQSRDSEQNAKLSYAQNALSYNKLIIQYRALMDRLYN